MIYHEEESDKYFEFYKDLLIAAQKNSTCKRLQVAAFIVKDGRVSQSGWNGSLPGQRHCTERFSHLDTTDPKFYEAHGKWSMRNESHAEISAIAFAAKHGIAIGGWHMAVTHTPCLPCAKTIIMAGITKVFYMEMYDRDPEGFNLLQELGVKCVQL